jgi:hypothetical protein
MINDDLRPSLQLSAHCFEFGETVEAQILDGILIGAHLSTTQFKAVYHTEMDTAHLRGVVIDQANDLLRVRALNDQLLGNLALDAIEVHRFAQAIVALIHWIDVPATRRFSPDFPPRV